MADPHLITELRQQERDYPSLLHAPLCGRAADEIARLRERVAELQAQCGYTESIKDVEIERLRAGIQNYLDGDYEPRVKKVDKCPHGRYGYEECGSCIDEYFTKLLAAPTGKQTP